MKRGEVWTASGGAAYAGKPRPVVIVQDDRFAATNSVTVCGLTSTGVEDALPRPLIQPSNSNGLLLPSRVMVDKIVTIPRQRLGRQIGVLSHQDMVSLNRAVVVFLGLAG